MSGLYLEGADWDTEKSCLVKSKPKVLVVELPILKVIPIEARRLRLQVGTTGTTGLHAYSTLIHYSEFFFLTVVCIFMCFFCTAEYDTDASVHHVSAEECNGCGVVV